MSEITDNLRMDAAMNGECLWCYDLGEILFYRYKPMTIGG